MSLRHAPIGLALAFAFLIWTVGDTISWGVAGIATLFAVYVLVGLAGPDSPESLDEDDVDFDDEERYRA